MNPLSMFRPTIKSSQRVFNDYEEAHWFHFAEVNGNNIYLSIFDSGEERAIAIIFINGRPFGYGGSIKDTLIYLKNKLNND